MLIDVEGLSRPDSWRLLMDQVDVYALTLPDRAQHIWNLLEKWQFDDATVFFGILKETINLDKWAKEGKIVRNELVNSGRVACHFGHRGIMEDFLRKKSRPKKWLLIFEDDLVDAPAEDVQQNLLDFLAEVPTDFDILHLGFLWESRQNRIQVSQNVFRTKMAVGRHAYMLTRDATRLLLRVTLPQVEAGDEMYKKAIEKHKMTAYQPEEPLFNQDREKFVSYILMYKRPARVFRPDDEALKKWQAEAANYKKKHQEEHEAKKQQIAQIDQSIVDKIVSDLEDRKANPRVDLSEPLLLVGSLNEWCPETASKKHAFQAITNVLGTTGSWALTDASPFSISRANDGNLYLQSSDSTGRPACGVLHPEGNWLTCHLIVDDNIPWVMVRLCYIEADDTLSVNLRDSPAEEWGDMLVATRRENEDEEVVHMLHLRLATCQTTFQIISAKEKWHWRLYPADLQKMMLVKDAGSAVPAAISVGTDDGAHHGRNFQINEPKGGLFTIFVSMKKRRRVVWYSQETPDHLRNSGAQAANSTKSPAAGSFLASPQSMPADEFEPLRLVGDFNQWDEEAEGCELIPQDVDTNSGWRTHRLCLRLRNSRLTFQIVSSKISKRWRCYPKTRTKSSLLRNQPSMDVIIGDEQDGRGCDFQIKEAQDAVVLLSVGVCASAAGAGSSSSAMLTKVQVMYELRHPSDMHAVPLSLKPSENYRIGRIQPLRLVGESCKWNTRTCGLEFVQPSESGDWREHRLCCRMQGDHIDFQIISSQLGFRWRCYPKAGAKLIPRGRKNEVEVSIGGTEDGHGCNFRVEETAFSIITISVWLRVAKEATYDKVQQVMVAYRVQDTGLSVGIGPTHVQFPMKRLADQVGKK